MNKQDITTMIEFNLWANGRLLAACEALTPAEFTAEVTPDPGWGSLRGILVHTLDTEYGWRSALQAQDDIILNASDFPDIATLKARWDLERDAWLSYMNELTDDVLNQGYGQDPTSGPKVWQTIMHVVLHSMQHRSEAAAFLTGLGYSPGELDLAVFMQTQ